jgi:hypothetical protein
LKSARLASNGGRIEAVLQTGIDAIKDRKGGQGLLARRFKAGTNTAGPGFSRTEGWPGNEKEEKRCSLGMMK